MNYLERREFEPRAPSFEEMLTKVTFTPNRSIDPTIQKIDLGSCADFAQELRDKTKVDPKHQEKVRVVEIINDKFPKIGEPRLAVGEILSAKIISSTRHELNTSTRIIQVDEAESRRNLLKMQRQNKFIATALHTHPAESTPSSKDIFNILTDDIEDTGAHTCVFVATPEKNSLIFRGPLTPSLSKRDMPEFEKEWERKKTALEANKALEISVLKWGKIYAKHIISQHLTGKPNKEYLELNNVLEHEVANEIIKKYGLIVFSGPADSRTVNKMTVLSV